MFFFTVLLEFLCSMQQYLHYKNLLEPITIVIKLHYCHHWERKLNTSLVKNSKVFFPTEGRTKRYESLREYLETQREKKKKKGLIQTLGLSCKYYSLALIQQSRPRFSIKEPSNIIRMGEAACPAQKSPLTCFSANSR